MDIALVKDRVPSHNLLVGGFPCQDYSVARTGAKGIEGKKGALWWEINDIIKANLPNYVLLENVDRLIKSPAYQRGRDLGVIIRCLYDLGYAVEWRIINAADYGYAQRRRRIFIFAFKNTTPLFRKLADKVNSFDTSSLHSWITSGGFYAPAFPVSETFNATRYISKCIDEHTYSDLAKLASHFYATFFNAGVMINGRVFSEETSPRACNPVTLREIRVTDRVEDKYFLNGSTEKWEYLKGSKKIERIRPNGELYNYTEGRMSFPDNLDLPARTMLTSESSVNRSTHVIEDYTTGRLRLLTPIECERINGFPDNWTNTDMPEKARYFVMGNALVVPVITAIGNRILEVIPRN